jgi:hypothetical protein
LEFSRGELDHGSEPSAANFAGMIAFSLSAWQCAPAKKSSNGRRYNGPAAGNADQSHQAGIQ